MAPRIEIITERERFAAIQPHWDALWRRCKADVFQHHAWIAAWLEVSAAYSAIRIAVAWDGDDILAALPLTVRRHIGIRTLEWSAQSLSDYCDALETSEGAVLPLLWHEIWQTGRFDLVNITQVRPDAAARQLFDRDGTRHTVVKRRDRRERCFAIDCVWPSSEAWFRSLGKKGRNNYWRGERILTALGGEIAFHCLDPTMQSIERELRYVLELKWDSLRLTKPSSSLLGRDGRTLEVMLRAVTCTGLMKLFLLTCGDRIAAASVNFVRGDQMQAYMTAFDPAFDRASPGTLLIVRYTRWAIDNGLSQVDFLRGDEPFKSRLANTEITLSSYMGGRTAIGSAALALHRLRLRLRGQSPRAHTEAVAAASPGFPHLSDGDSWQS